MCTYMCNCCGCVYVCAYMLWNRMHVWCSLCLNTCTIVCVLNIPVCMCSKRMHVFVICMDVCLCMRVLVYVWVCVCICECMFLCAHVYLHADATGIPNCLSPVLAIHEFCSFWVCDLSDEATLNTASWHVYIAYCVFSVHHSGVALQFDEVVIRWHAYILIIHWDIHRSAHVLLSSYRWIFEPLSTYCTLTCYF